MTIRNERMRVVLDQVEMPATVTDEKYFQYGTLYFLRFSETMTNAKVTTNEKEVP